MSVEDLFRFLFFFFFFNDTATTEIYTLSLHDALPISSLMRRQLPAITHRLQQTLDKLQKPDASNGRFIKADTWWEGLQRSYAGRGVEFSREGQGDSVMLPKELFDSAGDNLLQNALRKRRLDESVG